MKTLKLNPATGCLELTITVPVDFTGLAHRLLTGEEVAQEDVEAYVTIVGLFHDRIKPACAPFSFMRYMRHKVNTDTDMSVTFVFFDYDRGVEVEEKRNVTQVLIWITHCLANPLIFN